MNANERRYESDFSQHVIECQQFLCSANLSRDPPVAEMLHKPQGNYVKHLRLSAFICGCFVIAVVTALTGRLAAAGAELRWERFAPLPDSHGFAGSFAGVSDGALLVAGGANFPDGKPWEGGAKVWHGIVFVLESPHGAWKAAGKLPLPLAYGVAISHERG